MEYFKVSSEEIPGFLLDAARTPPMLRLQDVGMNCGCEYTSFPQFANLPRYSRWQHSLGVARIVWRFTRDPAQALAGLLHDIATPTFAHVIDFLRGDHLLQESTEDGTRQMIAESPELQAVLASLALSTDEVCDYHRYPVADNDAPWLSADRLEYTLGNAVNYGFCDEAWAKRCLDDLRVGTNEDGGDELMFETPEIAHAFALNALKCSRVYVSDADRYAMQALANLLRDACAEGIVTERDLHATESELIAKLCRSDVCARRWCAFRALRETRAAAAPGREPGWLRIPTKKRRIDPMVMGQGRASRLFPDFADDLAAFMAQPQDYWVLGV